MKNIGPVFIKELKHHLREKKANIMMILFPIALIVILGSALSSMFNTTKIELDGVKVLYTNMGGSQLEQAFTGFIEQAGKMGVMFEETDDSNLGIEMVKQADYSCYVLLKDNPRVIRLYKNNRYNFEANLVETLLNAFVERYNAISEIARENPAALADVMDETDKEFYYIKSLDGKRKPTSTDYYSVAILTMVLMYSSIAGMSSIRMEKSLKTGNRILCSPVKKHEILIGKVMGCIMITILQSLMVFLFSKLILNAYWGDNIGVIIAIIASEAILTVSFGTCIGFTIKNEGLSVGIINTVIPIIVMLGGGYVPLDTMGEFVQKLSVVSPIKWTNQAIFRLIYNSDFSYVPVSIAVNLIISALLITVSSIVYRKEAVW